MKLRKQTWYQSNVNTDEKHCIKLHNNDSEKFNLAPQPFKKGKMPILLEHKDTSHICFYSRDLQEVVKVSTVNDDFHYHLHPWPSLQPLLSDVAPPCKPCSSVGTENYPAGQ